MASHYIDIQGVYEELLEFSGYVLVGEDDEFQLFVKDGVEYVVPRRGVRFLAVEPRNPAELRFSRRRVVPIPR
jgi:hypothetical protein